MALSSKGKTNKMIIEITLWVLIIIGGYFGYAEDGVLGLVCGVLATFLIEALIVVPFYTLFKINARVKEMKEMIEQMNEKMNAK